MLIHEAGVMSIAMWIAITAYFLLAVACHECDGKESKIKLF